MTQNLWNAFEAAASTGGALCARGDYPEGDLPEETWVASGLSIDTRTISKGDIFVALQDQRDGHDFVANAFEAGASVALVSRAPEDTPEGKPLLVVSDTLTGLQDLAAAARDRCYGKLIGVTGSAGKTSTKEMLRAALNRSGIVHAAERSFNNHLGVPLTLAALPKEADYGIFEIGMNHAGEITPLTQLVKPHITIVTTVAAAHLEFFNSVEEIAEAKAEIFKGLRNTSAKSGTAILPFDNAYFDLLKKRAEENGCRDIISFGTKPGSDYQLKNYEIGEDGRAHVSVAFGGDSFDFRLGLTGQHQAMNALAVLAAVVSAGGDIANAIQGLEAMAAVEGRGARHVIKSDEKTVTLIDESYNANPASMLASFNVLKSMPCTSRRIAVLGEMKELGDDATQLHAALAEDIKETNIDLVFAAGPMMMALYDQLPEQMRGGYAETAVALLDEVKSTLRDGDIVMAKGSNASKVSVFVKEFLEGGL